MRKLILRMFRQYLRLGFFFYYKRFKVYGKENIPKEGAVMFLPNHRNMLIDPLVVAVSTNRLPTFLTRSDVFIKGIIDKTLRFLGMLPIYRIRDGYSSLRRNQEIFDISCQRLAEKYGTVLLFPEASSSPELRMRPLSKGFTRLIFQSLETRPELNLQIQPIGLNYAKVNQFPDSVSVYFQPTIPALNYLPENGEIETIPAELVQKLKDDVQHSLSEVVVDIPKENYAEKEKHLYDSNLDLIDAPKVNALLKGSEDLASVLKKEDSFFLYRVSKNTLKFLLILLCLPCYLLWKWFEKRIQDKEFVDTYRYVFTILLMPVYLLLVFLIVKSYFGVKMASGLVGLIVLIELLYVKL